MASLFLALLALSLPNPRLTPGLARSLGKQQICTTKWGLDHRFVTQKMKKQICLAYGIKSGCPGPEWALDHLIPRELGGADDIKNIWPQHIVEARQKDKIENELHREFCAGSITLEQAQQRVKHWYNEGSPSPAAALKGYLSAADLISP